MSKEDNELICNRLNLLIEKYPKMRFSQILVSFGFVKQDGKVWVDDFYTSSEDILVRVLTAMREYDNARQA